MDLSGLRNFLINHLFEKIIPFWLTRGIDWERGGFFTCFNNLGDKLVSGNKYVWSQARFLWTLSHLYRFFKDQLDSKELERIRMATERGAAFLLDNALLPDGTCAWLLTDEGLPVENRDGLIHRSAGGSIIRHPAHRGIEADEFLIYGFVEFSIAFDNRKYFEIAYDIYNSVIERIKSNTFFSAPYGVPVGYKSHGIPMLLLETTREMIIGARYWKDPNLDRLVKIGQKTAEESVVPFKWESGRVMLEMVKEDGEVNPDAMNEMIGSYYNPGHTLEHAWFLIDFARTLEGVGYNLPDIKRWVDEGLLLIDWMIEKSWDDEFGGIPQFLHVDWGRPRGRVLKENENDKLITYLSNHWDKKLWWVHSEALYALLLGYVLTGRPNYWKYYEKVHNYTFDIFPNKDLDVGEWVQIRDRRGTPVEEVVALPVKDPFHVPRALMLMVELLEQKYI